MECVTIDLNTGDFMKYMENNVETNKYIIINLNTMDYMKDMEDNVEIYDSIEEALEVCGIYEFKDVWVCELKYNYKEKD